MLCLNSSVAHLSGNSCNDLSLSLSPSENTPPTLASILLPLPHGSALPHPAKQGPSLSPWQPPPAQFTLSVLPVGTLMLYLSVTVCLALRLTRKSRVCMHIFKREMFCRCLEISFYAQFCIGHKLCDFYPWMFPLKYFLAMLRMYMYVVALYKKVMKWFKGPHSWISGQAFPLSQLETL